MGEHRHPALVERFTVLDGELTLKLDGRTSILREGESAVIEAGAWHDWWNASDRDARVRVEITPGERFALMIETMFGLARLGSTNAKGMPDPLQLALTAQEFSDVIVFRKPPAPLQRAVLGVLAPIARWRGYRATYPQLSRTLLAPRNRCCPAVTWHSPRRNHRASSPHQLTGHRRRPLVGGRGWRDRACASALDPAWHSWLRGPFRRGLRGCAGTSRRSGRLPARCRA
jgi:Cupin domain